MLQAYSPDVALLDLSLLQPEAVNYLRALYLAHSSIPFILFAEADDRNSAVECLSMGARDFLLEGYMDERTVARVLKSAVGSREETEMIATIYADSEAGCALSAELETDEVTKDQTESGASGGAMRGLLKVLEHSVYGVFRVSLAGSFVFANPALLEILACSSFEALQSLSFSSDVFRFPEHCAKVMASCHKDGLVHRAETEWRRKDGGLVAVKLHLRYLNVPEGDQIEGIVEDVTELRSLEHHVLQAQKFETIGQLAGGVAHDFNNVVGAILGWAELGYEESLAFPRIAERFVHIREQADRAASLTRELLAFARCQELQPRPVDINTIIQSLTSFLDKVIGSDIEMKVAPGKLQPIQADPVQIEQVLMNLCLNARDAMPEGGRLAIETEMEQIDESFCRYYPYASAGWSAVLSVSDTGIGMTQEIRERIFEPFFTTKERGAGSGMGLATRMEL